MVVLGAYFGLYAVVWERRFPFRPGAFLNKNRIAWMIEGREMGQHKKAMRGESSPLLCEMVYYERIWRTFGSGAEKQRFQAG
jgi:hypothetical protein